MTQAKVEKGIAIPLRAHGGRRACSKYPLDQMEVGDSYFVSCATRKDRVSAASAAHKWGKANKRIFTSRSVEGGLRIWLVSVEAQ